MKTPWESESAVMTWLTSYRPKMIDPMLWDDGVGDFVRAEVGRLAVDLETMKRFTRALARLAAWCVRNGIALDVESVLDPDTVERFLILSGATEADSTVATWRCELRRIGPALTKQAAWEPAPPGVSRPSLPPPYGQREVRLLERDAGGQATPHRSRLVRGVVALGLGVGLDGRWNAKIVGSDVQQTCDGVVVAVPAPQPRVVTARARYADELLALAERAGSGPLLGGNGSKNVSNRIAAAARIDRGRLTLHVGRLRSTWIVAQLTAGTHVGVVLTAAGIERLESLRDLIAFIALPAADAAADQLRRA